MTHPMENVVREDARLRQVRPGEVLLAAEAPDERLRVLDEAIVLRASLGEHRLAH